MSRKIRVTSEGTVWTLPWDVGVKKGFMAAEGIDAEVVTPDSQLQPADVFERPIASDYECGDLEGYNKCEWGVIKRAADGERDGWILGRRESVATMAIIVRGDSSYHRLDDLADVPISIQDQTGSHYMTFKMLEGHCDKDRVQLRHDGGPAIRIRHAAQRRSGGGNAHGAVHQSGREPRLPCAGGVQVLGAPVRQQRRRRRTPGKSIFRALRRSVDEINSDLKKHAALLLRDIPEDLIGDFKPEDLNLNRLDYVYPEDYTEEEFNRAWNWMAGYGLKPDSQAAYSDLVKL